MNFAERLPFSIAILARAELDLRCVPGVGELRFERAYNMPAYDRETKQNQSTFAIDAIFRY